MGRFGVLQTFRDRYSASDWMPVFDNDFFFRMGLRGDHGYDGGIRESVSRSICRATRSHIFRSVFYLADVMCISNKERASDSCRNVKLLFHREQRYKYEAGYKNHNRKTKVSSTAKALPVNTRARNSLNQYPYHTHPLPFLLFPSQPQ